MNKLIMRLPIILIGLSLISCDPKESFYIDIYDVFFINETNEELKLVFHSVSQNINSSDGNTIKTVDTLILTPKGRSSYKYFSSPYHEFEKNNTLIIIKNTVNELLYLINDEATSKFEVFIGNQFIVDWNPPAGSYGNEINSPYNYDSWKVIKYKDVLNPKHGEFVYGEIIFTITNKDIE